MPPERLLGRGGIDEVRCEVYALGVTLYEAATLARPRQVPADLTVRDVPSYLAGAPIPPPRSVRPAIPCRHERIIRRAMDPDPKRRHPDAKALAGALTGFADGQDP